MMRLYTLDMIDFRQEAARCLDANSLPQGEARYVVPNWMMRCLFDKRSMRRWKRKAKMLARGILRYNKQCEIVKPMRIKQS